MSQPGAATPSRGEHQNGAQSHEYYSMWDAAYVLGSLSCAERREFEEHVSACALCGQAVAEISGMPALLARLGADEVAAIDEGQTTDAVPPLRPELLNSLLWKVSQRRRRSRMLTWTFAVAAAAVLVVALFVGLRSNPALPAPSGPAESNAAALTMTPVAPTSLSATLRLTSHDWGTRIEMVCTYGAEEADHDDGRDELAMVVVSRDGKQTRVATWMALDGTTATPGASTSLPLDQIAAVQVVSTQSGNVFLQRSL
jgi:hypothetical protein